ncbi:class I SAM-dependent methyltransferase [Sphingomonas sp.]|uniref:class I SAM-dependent methyltransferase n=1 Tax=Sphingomonas sp. TaxID=28214 RepID=UPI002DD6559A|nr:class I SAM-dependent methyltransferase [Sphingomonas sp.]
MSHYPYSMAMFDDLIVDALTIAGAQSIVEVGADYGGMSDTLAAYAAANGGTLTSVDPEVQDAFLAWLADHPEVTHVAEPSIDALAKLPAADAYIIDGDHNWYTVYNELALVRGAARAAGKPVLALLHDVCWPCGRRDFYYAPDRIPEAYRHPHARDAGASIDWDGLMPGRGLTGGETLAMALHEGGPMNGVLTAVEDFLEGARGQGDDLCYVHIPGALGLGVIFDTGAPWAEALAAHLLPWHNNRLIATLEENRLRNFLHALDAERALAA